MIKREVMRQDEEVRDEQKQNVAARGISSGVNCSVKRHREAIPEGCSCEIQCLSA